MSRFSRTLLTASIVALMAFQDLVSAQATSRGSSSRSGGASRSGSAGRAPSSRRAPSRPPATHRPAAAKPRAAKPAPPTKSGSSSSSATSAGTPLGARVGSEAAAVRVRDGGAVVGHATSRSATIFDTVFLPTHQHFSRFGFGVGFGSRFNRPFGSFGFGRYGSNLFLPYSYGSWGAGAGSRYSAGRSRMGSIRLKVSPRTAQVYIDGGLVGVVDDFDGLTRHLELEAGRYRLELRADGYEVYAAEISVSGGRTKTERVTMKAKREELP